MHREVELGILQTDLSHGQSGISFLIATTNDNTKLECNNSFNLNLVNSPISLWLGG